MNEKEKQFDPARQNETSPAPGMASVNTHNPAEQQTDERLVEQQEPEKNSDKNPPPHSRH